MLGGFGLSKEAQALYMEKKYGVDNIYYYKTNTANLLRKISLRKSIHIILVSLRLIAGKSSMIIESLMPFGSMIIMIQLNSAVIQY